MSTRMYDQFTTTFDWFRKVYIALRIVSSTHHDGGSRHNSNEMAGERRTIFV